MESTFILFFFRRYLIRKFLIFLYCYIRRYRYIWMLDGSCSIVFGYRGLERLSEFKVGGRTEFVMLKE